MKVHSEVNFEKRGKLTDHDPCPVTGECQCCCYHCRPPKRLLTLLVSLSLCLLVSSAYAAEYTFQTIEFPDATSTIAQSINDAGQVTGTHQTIEYIPGQGPVFIQPPQGFRWLNGKFDDVVFPGSAQTFPTSNNNQGDIVGTFDLPFLGSQSFLYRNKVHAKAKKATIDVLPLPIAGLVIGLNDGRDFVGETSLLEFLPGLHRQVGFLVQDGHATLIDPEVSCTVDQPASSARGINGDLVIVGFTFCSQPFGWVAFVSYDGGDSYILFDFPGTLRTTIANSVNERGEIAGNYQDSNGTHGFVFSNGFISVDVPGASWTIVSGINRRGEVTGSFLDPSGIVKSFIATPERGWRR